jgi:Carboxypeptidase regulatory-like domain/TonB dependent receptor
MRRALLALPLLCTAAHAQVSSAVLSGIVTDPSSAVISGATITASQKDTGFTRTGISDAHGGYKIEGLAPGAYTVTAAKEGFRDFEITGVTLEVNQQARRDFQLTVGDSHARITVEASVSPVDSDDASHGYRMDNQRITELPLESRNVVALVTLGPGAIPRQLGGFTHDVNNDVQEGTRGSVALNPPINGARSTMNTFLVDGAYDTDRNTFAIAVYPPTDSVQEFHIQTSLASAEFPQSGGGAIDVVTKSGTKRLHGGAFEYFNNEATDARNFFDDPTLSRPIFRQNEFGASLGGPAPRLKNTFFYGIYEGLRQKAGNSALSLVPDSLTRSGNFQGQNVIYDPLTNVPRTPFPNDIVPQNRIDPIAVQFLAKFEPLPNSNSSGGNYLNSTPNVTSTDSESGRIDHQFADQSLLTGRYTINGETNIVAGSFPELPTSEQVRAQQAAIGFTKSRTGWIDEARFSFTRLRLYDVPESAFHDNIAKDLGLANPPTNPFFFGLPYFNATDYSMVTDSPTLPQTQRDNLWQASDGFSLMRGRHALKFGGDFLHFQLNYLQSNLARGEYVYTGAFTSVDGSGVGSGDPFADFLLGAPQITQQTVGSGQAYMRQNDFAVYAQDNFRVSPELTINLGIRWEYASPYTEARDNLLNLNYSSLPNQPTLQRVNSAVNPDYHNFSPRIGLAYRLPKLLPGGASVFRAGYGVYFSQEIAVETYDLILNGESNQANQTNGNVAPVLSTQNGFAHTASSGFPSYFGIDPNARTPYVQQWNAGVQHELPRRVLLDVSYIGSKGTHLGRYRQFNTPAHVEIGQDLAPRPGDLQSLRTWPDLGEIIQRQHIANSDYQSLQVKVEKTLSARLSLLTSFVWSKSLDDADSPIVGLFDSVGAQDERNLRLERGLSFANPGRRIAAGYVYKLPEGHSAALRNWTLSGTVTLQDGTPVNPFYFGLDFANSGTPNRPNIVPGQSISLPRSVRSANEFFNTGAFSAPAPFTFGDAGRDIIPGPGNNIFDFSLARRFPIRDRGAVEFRASAFNAFNHPNWGIPGPNPDFGPFFGKIFSSGEPRRIQFALRYDF